MMMQTQSVQVPTENEQANATTRKHSLPPSPKSYPPNSLNQPAKTPSYPEANRPQARVPPSQMRSSKAKAKLRAERREDLERGRIKDVLGLNSGTAGEIAEEEKRLRKIAQRGVVKLFNAIR